MNYEAHPHKPRNANAIRDLEHVNASFNQRIAVKMTEVFSSMPTFWVILVGMGLWMGMNAGIMRIDPPPWQFLLTYGSLVQLPLMVLIMVGQSVLSRHQELQADEVYRMAQKTCHDNQTIIDQNNHLLSILAEKDVDISDQIVERILFDLNNAIRQCKTVEEAQQLVWKLASREEMK